MNVKYLLLALMLWTGLFCTVDVGFAEIWFQTSAPIQNWTGIAMSADGHKQVAVANGGGVYVSKDFGISWRLTSAPDESWEAVASSADGSKLVAVGIDAFSISKDGGVTWVNNQLPPGGFWVSATISATGGKIAAVDIFDTLVYTSTNLGVSWSSNSIASLDNYQSFGLSRYIAGSADGTKLAVATLGGTIFVSKDSGGTWTATTAPIAAWTCIASSIDGNRLVATAADLGEIYVSKDSGANWELTSAPNQAWFGVDCSWDGKKIVAGAGGWSESGSVFTSLNFGKSWRQIKAPDMNWYSVACSAAGNIIVSSAFGGGLYIGIR